MRIIVVLLTANGREMEANSKTSIYYVYNQSSRSILELVDLLEEKFSNCKWVM